MNNKWYAEQANYFGTSQRAAETWLKLAAKELEAIGAKEIKKAAVEENDTAVYVIEFMLDGERFRMAYPAMECKSKTAKNLEKANRQAATFLYHAVKARALDVKILGAKLAFGVHLLIDGNRTIADVISGNLSKTLPVLLEAPKKPTSGVIEGEFTNA